MKNKHRLDITLEIDVRFGSEFQKDSFSEALEIVSRAWQEFYKARHK